MEPFIVHDGDRYWEVRGAVSPDDAMRIFNLSNAGDFRMKWDRVVHEMRVIRKHLVKLVPLVLVLFWGVLHLKGVTNTKNVRLWKMETIREDTEEGYW